MDDNQTFQDWWDQWVVVLDRVRTDRPNSSDRIGPTMTEGRPALIPPVGFPTLCEFQE